MKTWQVAGPGRHCGNCGTVLAADAPVLLIRPLAMKRDLVRCADCAGEPVPAAIPTTPTPPEPRPLVVGPQPEPIAVPKRMARVETPRRDSKQRQVGGDL